MKDESELRKLLEEDPGNPQFVDLAELLREQDRLLEAKEVCFSGLTVNPSCSRGRLVLARIFWQQQQNPFAVRELELLKRDLPENLVIGRLLARLSPSADLSSAAHSGSDAAAETAETIAEAEFDLDAIEALDGAQE